MWDLIIKCTYKKYKTRKFWFITYSYYSFNYFLKSVHGRKVGSINIMKIVNLKNKINLYNSTKSIENYRKKNPNKQTIKHEDTITFSI